MNEHVPATKISERLLLRPEGATMSEIVAATGGPQYNTLKKLEGRGYHIRKVKEGNTTRYYAEPPASPHFEATVTSKGQVTIPKEVRDFFGLRDGMKLRFVIEDGGRVAMQPASKRLSELGGVLPKAKRVATLEEIDEDILQGAVERSLRPAE